MPKKKRKVTSSIDMASFHILGNSYHNGVKHDHPNEENEVSVLRVHRLKPVLSSRKTVFKRTTVVESFKELPVENRTIGV